MSEVIVSQDFSSSILCVMVLLIINRDLRFMRLAYYFLCFGGMSLLGDICSFGFCRDVGRWLS